MGHRSSSTGAADRHRHRYLTHRSARSVALRSRRSKAPVAWGSRRMVWGFGGFPRIGREESKGLAGLQRDV